MKLLVDIGNTRLKWAFGTAAGFVAYGEALRNAEDALRPVLESAQVPDEIRIANVAGAGAGARIGAALQATFGVVPLMAVSAAKGAGVRSGYQDPAQLGVDRWLAVCATFSRYRGPVCVVDAGTATTIDLVFASGEHQGGLILPGMDLMRSALMTGTGDLARLSVNSDRPGVGRSAHGERPAPHPIALGRDTAAAIRYGALQATTCLVRACGERLGASSPQANPWLIITGGAAPDLKAALLDDSGGPGAASPAASWLECRPLLVLEGLALDPPCFQVAG